MKLTRRLDSEMSTHTDQGQHPTTPTDLDLPLSHIATHADERVILNQLGLFDHWITAIRFGILSLCNSNGDYVTLIKIGTKNGFPMYPYCSVW